jgi:hypothetical protein
VVPVLPALDDSAVRPVPARFIPPVLAAREEEVELSDAAITAISLAVFAMLLPIIILLEKMCRKPE